MAPALLPLFQQRPKGNFSVPGRPGWSRCERWDSGERIPGRAIPRASWERKERGKPGIFEGSLSSPELQLCRALAVLPAEPVWRIPCRAMWAVKWLLLYFVALSNISPRVGCTICWPIWLCLQQRGSQRRAHGRSAPSRAPSSTHQHPHGTHRAPGAGTADV